MLEFTLFTGGVGDTGTFSWETKPEMGIYMPKVCWEIIQGIDSCEVVKEARLSRGQTPVQLCDGFYVSALLGHYFANKGPSSQAYGFSSGHLWMWELDCEESWAPKNWCFWTVVLEKTLESPLETLKEMVQPVHPKGDQSWVFIGRTDIEAETPILWPPDAKSWLIWKDIDAGKD